MSANIPFEIQEEIIKRVYPVKSLIRFRSISKQWKSLIDNSEFITYHAALNHRSDPEHLLVRYNVDSEYKYVLIVNNDSFPQQKSSLDVSPTDKLVSPGASMIGCCHGLVCLEGYDPVNRRKMIVVWNPSIRKSIGIRIPQPDRIYTFGFGICSKTGDAMIVGITRSTPVSPWQAEVFRLSSRAWKSVPINLHRSLTDFSNNQVVVDGAIHWIAYCFMGRINGRYYYVCRIISFDLTSEEFEHVELPERLARSESMYLSKLKESLVVLDSCTGIGMPNIDVWMKLKNHASTTSFTKLFTIKVPMLHKIIGFRKNGQPIMEPCVTEKNQSVRLKVYEPSSKHINDLEIVRDYGSSSFEMATYTESLLLHNISTFIIL